MEKRISRKSEFNYAFDHNKKPILKVEEGESFIVETEDNFSGILKTEKDLPIFDGILKPVTKYDPPKFNPMAGPVYVDGAARGDLLEISIEKIIPADSGISTIVPGIGPLSDTKKWPELGDAYTKILKNIPGPSGTTRDGKCVYGKDIQWDLNPMIGSIGVAPDYEVFGSLFGQTPCCGNWDCRDIKEGSKLYVNCFHEGALLFLGDVHASQGDAELTGFANESKAEVTLSCRVIKNKKIPYARIVKEKSIIQLFAEKPMEDAVHRAIINLIDWMVQDFKVKPRDAYIMLSCNSDFRINVYQMLNVPMLKYVVGAEIPKSYLL